MSDGTTGPENGITGGYQGNNPVILRAMLAFTVIALYNAIELTALIFITFKKYSGTYFWSLLITTLGLIPCAFGAWAKQDGISNTPLAMVSVSTFGWMFVVPGQSVVLWSRLNCLTQNQRLLRGILIMIVVDTILLVIPTFILTIGSNTAKADLFVKGYGIMEKIQMTWFTLQELFISAVYLVEVKRILSVAYDGRFRKLMVELIAINIAIILMDVALLGVEYVSLYQIEVTLKSMIYSIKLKLEFGVLSKLVKIATARQGLYSFGTKDTLDGQQGTGTNFDMSCAMTTVPSGSTYTTSRTLPTSFAPTANADVERYHDFETNVSFSQSTPLPKPPPQVQPNSPHSSRRGSLPSSTEDLYPGRLS